jgi:hypothetical protein
MQKLFIPEIIHIEILDKNGDPFRQENVLIGIQTFATHKNNISLSPFLSNEDGRITITKEQIITREYRVIIYGLMDYVGLISAKPDIEIYFWGNNKLDNYINYWENLFNYRKSGEQAKMLNKLLGRVEFRSTDSHKEEEEEFEIYSTCFNRTTDQKEDIILVTDIWDKPMKERNYRVRLLVMRK